MNPIQLNYTQLETKEIFGVGLLNHFAAMRLLIAGKPRKVVIMATKKPTQDASNSNDASGEKLPMQIIFAGTDLKDLAVVKKTLSDKAEIIAGNLPQTIIRRAIVEGIYRLLSADTAKAKGGTVEKELAVLDIFSRLDRGYWSQTEEDKAAKALTGGASKSGGLKFGRQEILGAIRDLISPDDTETLRKVETIAAYDETKFALFVEIQSAKPDSLVSLAIKQLTENAQAKAAAEMEKLKADLIDL